MKYFSKVGEGEVTEAIVKDFYKRFLDIIRTDCIIIGAGPSGLTAAKELSKDGFKTVIIEANNYLGGGFWIGGYLMNGITVRAPGEKVLDEIDAPYREVSEGLFLTEGPLACSKLIASTCESGARVINMTKFDDVVRKSGRVCGAVINWTPVSALPRAITCVDPVALESKVLIDATGHDAYVADSLAKRGLLNIKGFSGMCVEESEDMVVEKTGQVYPGLIAAGMAVATVFGLPRMGPTFGGMLLSGKKAAQIAKEEISKLNKEESYKAALPSV